MRTAAADCIVPHGAGSEARRVCRDLASLCREPENSADRGEAMDAASRYRPPHSAVARPAAAAVAEPVLTSRDGIRQGRSFGIDIGG
jgi:hypothetical protein